MISFRRSKCPKCGKTGELMFSNNPLSGDTICFDCINANLDYKNLEHADFFCRTYNLPFKPDIWMEMAKTEKWDVFKTYTSAILLEQEDRVNLYYSSSTRDVWAKANREWERCRSFAELLRRLEPIKESYIECGYIKWGEQYTFEELIKLDSIYSRTLKSNNITNPMQKEAVKTLCKLQIEMDEAIRAKDPKAIKDFSSAYSTFAKQADLETMINQTKTDDITTVAELYDYMEKSGFKFKFYDGFDRDEVDRAIKDIQDANRRLILESTGLQPLLEEMARARMRTVEEEATNEIVNGDVTLQDMLDFKASDGDIETEDDSEVLDMEFETETSSNKIIRKED
jgi:ribosomal protein S20